MIVCSSLLSFQLNDQILFIHSIALPVHLLVRTTTSSDFTLNVKGYLRYKKIASQNVSSEVQVKIFFILQKSYAPFSRYSSFCIFNQPIIYQVYDVMMSIST